MSLIVDREILRGALGGNKQAQPAAGGRPLTKRGLSLLGDELAGEMGRLAFGAEQDENQLPSELLNIEQGRRLTATESGLLQSPEQGRRASSLLEPQPLAFSPLRLSSPKPNSKAPSVVGGDDLLGGGDWQDDLLLGAGVEAGVAEMNPTMEVEEGGQAMSSPKLPREIRQRRSNKTPAAISLDKVTEITTAQLQAQVRDPSATLMPAASAKAAVDVQALLQMPMWAELCQLNEQLATLFQPSTRAMTMAKSFEPLDDYGGDLLPDGGHDFMAAGMEGEQEGDLNVPLALQWPSEPNQAELQQPLPSSPNKRPASLVSADHPLSPMMMASSPRPTPLAATTRWQQVLQAEWMPLNQALPMHNKREAAQAFFELLLLRTRGLVQGRQEAAYGAIEVKALPALFTATD